MVIFEGPSFSLPPQVKPLRIGDYLLQHRTGVTFNIALGCKVGEGSGTPLQYSCLEYPMDGGAW